MLHIVTWFWGEQYSLDYVKKLIGSVRRNLKLEHRIIVCTDDLYRKGITAREGRFDIDGVEDVTIVPIIRDLDLLKVKGCFARLRMFDPVWQTCHRIKEGDPVVCIDLDVVVAGSLDKVFAREEPFVILQGCNAVNPCPYNGSLWMFRAGYRPDVWTGFSLDAAAKVPFMSFPDDQAWFHAKMPDAAGWKAGPESGVYAFMKPGWPKGTDWLPHDARLVCFPGFRDPAKFAHLPWIQHNWRA